MEGAQAHVVGTAFLQLHVATDDVDDIGAGDQLLDKGLRDGHGNWRRGLSISANAVNRGLGLRRIFFVKDVSAGSR